MLAFHLVLPTLVTMIFPKRGKFNVTDKGGLLDVGYFDFTVVRPHLVVACLLAPGVIVGIVRAIGHDYFGSDPNVIALNVGWGIYSLIFLLAAIAVARENAAGAKNHSYRCRHSGGDPLRQRHRLAQPYRGSVDGRLPRGRA